MDIPDRPTDSLDEEIKILLHKKLVRQVINGRPWETVKFHSQQLLKELSEWIGSPTEEESNCAFRDQLLNLLATASKQNLKDIPADLSEWTKLLNKWVKANISDSIIWNREIYKILAVDGFYGFKPKYLKLYLSVVLSPLRNEYKMHVRGIRKMYDFIDDDESISSLSGTDSACVIFIALLQWYSSKMKDLLLDDQIMFQVQQVKAWAEGYLQHNSEYYRDLKNVDERLLIEIGKIYENEFENESWKIIGEKLFETLSTEVT